MSEPHLLRRYRQVLGLFIAGLVLSGLTAFPLLAEMRWASDLLGVGDATSADGQSGLRYWLVTLRLGLADTYAAYPWVAYGTDWLAFAHLVLAVFFIGPCATRCATSGCCRPA